MLTLTTEQKREFADAVRLGRGSPAIAEIDAIYADFERERACRAPVCNQSGECCRFEAYGHRLFVSTLEAARFDQHFAAGISHQTRIWDGTGCPYQVGGLCSVHPARPFGCRVYFCDPSSTRWQQDQYERFHLRIRELHDRSGVPYLYVEWREALASLGVEPSSRRESGLKLPIVE